MDRVLDRLWIGSSRDLDGAVPLRALGFSAVVDLRDGEHPHLLGVLTYRLVNRDGDPWTPSSVEAALDFVHEHVRHGRVLVACAAGMSRSVSIATAYLVRCGWDVAEALARVREARPKIAPMPAMLEAALAGAVGISLPTTTKVSAR